MKVLIAGFTKKQIIIWLAVILAVFASLIFSIWFGFQKIEKVSNDFLSAKTKIAALQMQAEDIRIFKENYESYSENLKKIDRMFVDEKNPLEFIEFLENSASETDVALVMSPLAFDGEQETLSFQAALKGSFPGILNFLKKIENGHYLIYTKNLSVFESSSEAGGLEAKLFVKIISK